MNVTTKIVVESPDTWMRKASSLRFPDSEVAQQSPATPDEPGAEQPPTISLMGIKRRRGDGCVGNFQLMSRFLREDAR